MKQKELETKLSCVPFLLENVLTSSQPKAFLCFYYLFSCKGFSFSLANAILIFVLLNWKKSLIGHSHKNLLVVRQEMDKFSAICFFYFVISSINIYIGMNVYEQQI